jgi:acyl carrier protein
MQRDEIRSGVRDFILQNILIDEPSDTLDDSTLLISTGIISSLAMLETVAFLEDTYSIALREHDLTPDRLDSVNLIVDLVEELRSAHRDETPA